MKVLAQRVSQASVSVGGAVVGEIGAGLLVFFCAERGDGEAEAQQLAAKVAKLRIFETEAGKMNLSILDTNGSALVVSQFTLAADLSRGNRPSFINAAEPNRASELYEAFCRLLEGQGVPVQKGRFAEYMAVSLVNDGPVTIWMESR